jgi:hypothetical protein
VTYVQRFSSDGRCVTNLPGLWSDDDIEITQTQFNHPRITSGQHTNGPANIFWRNPEGEWSLCPMTQLHKAVKWLGIYREKEQQS